MTTEKIKCFSCSKRKLITDFPTNKRKYQIKSSKGVCSNCYTCELKWSLKTMSAIRFNFEKNQFDIIKFKTKQEVKNFIKHEKETRS